MMLRPIKSRIIIVYGSLRPNKINNNKSIGTINITGVMIILVIIIIKNTVVMNINLLKKLVINLGNYPLTTSK